MRRSTEIHEPRPSDSSSLRWVAVLLVLVSGCVANQRAVAAEADRIAAAMGLEPGMIVADVGAGDGEWSVELADRVGPDGHVWATEVDPDLIEEISQRLDDAGHRNYTTVEGDQSSIGLPEGCCDAILLRMVYHHFEEPARMRADLSRALRPGGTLVVIDITPQTDWRELPDVPDRGGHGIPIDDLVAEMAQSGFEEVARFPEWRGDDEDRFCVVFR